MASQVLCNVLREHGAVQEVYIGLYWDNGKENGSQNDYGGICSFGFRRYGSGSEVLLSGIMENKMETTVI